MHKSTTAAAIHATMETRRAKNVDVKEGENDGRSLPENNSTITLRNTQ